MKVIVDTCIWSLALRRDTKNKSALVSELQSLIQEVRVQMLGPIRQEILSGIKAKKQFNLLKSHLSVFPDLILETEDYEKAAQFFNICRSKGVQGSNTDFLICAISVNRNFPIFTIDRDFEKFQEYIPIKLHAIRK